MKIVVTAENLAKRIMPDGTDHTSAVGKWIIRLAKVVFERIKSERTGILIQTSEEDLRLNRLASEDLEASERSSPETTQHPGSESS